MPKKHPVVRGNINLTFAVSTPKLNGLILLNRPTSLFNRMFRVVPGRECVDHFSSDRSHMIQKGGSYSAQPPDFTPLR